MVSCNRLADWSRVSFSSDKKVLEVACNMGTTAIELAKHMAARLPQLIDSAALAQARLNGDKAGVGDASHLSRLMPRKLPMMTILFDIVITKAMLTMHGAKGKAKCMDEYYQNSQTWSALHMSHAQTKDGMSGKSDQRLSSRL